MNVWLLARLIDSANSFLLPWPFDVAAAGSQHMSTQNLATGSREEEEEEEYTDQLLKEADVTERRYNVVPDQCAHWGHVYTPHQFVTL